ncbi:E3 ubiquitin ligase family protein [Candidatus Micrarchaeota archaeon]|nr:E3 ubiquitin ligase family protein [Candidatus Micrarchaeota archaeon]
MSSTGKCIGYAAVGFLAGLAFLYDGLQRYLRVQKINNTPTSKVRSAAIGLVELYGKTKGELNSPISKNKCGYWKLVAQWYKSGKHGGWRNFYTKSSTEPFYLEDETGKILVDPTNAVVEIPHDNLFQGYISGKGMFGMPHKLIDAQILNFVNNADDNIKSKFMRYKDRDVRIYEYFIAEEDSVYVLGTAESKEGTRSDIAHENLIIRKGKNEMYISDSHEKKIVSGMMMSAYWRIFGGFALSAICLLILLGLLGV